MAITRGKQFEKKFEADFSKIEQTSCYRLYDTTSRYMGIRNVCDFICYKYPNEFYIECKTKTGNTFPLQNLTQYEGLLSKKNIKGIIVGVILWFLDHDKILFIPIQTFEKLKKDGKKSFNINMIGDSNYKSILIPSIKKRVFLDSDYTVLFNIEDKINKENI